MIHSFVITNCQKNIDLTQNIGQFYPGSVTKQFTLDGFTLALRSNSDIDVEKVMAKKDNLTLFLSGKIINLESLKKMLMMYDSKVIEYTAPEIVLTLYRFLGKKGIQFLEGSFSIAIIFNHEILEFYSDSFNSVPVYYCVSRDNYFWVTNEVKTLMSLETIDLTLNSLESYRFETKGGSSYSIFAHVKKLPPAHQLMVVCSNKLRYSFETRAYKELLEEKNEIRLTKDAALPLIEKLLNDAIDESLSEKPLAIPLSGGLDSSLIASMTKRQVDTLYTFAIGTEKANEFYFSRKVSEFIGSHHQEIVINEEDLLNGMLNTVFYNEVVSSLCTEIQTPFYFLYSQIKNHANYVLTGYGADSIFGGLLPLTAELSTVNHTLRVNKARTIWRGEYTAMVSSKMGLFVQHPFCSSKLVALALQLDPKLKLYGNHVKYILRELANEKEYLPKTIAYREKIAIEVASAINQIFSHYLGLGSASSYQQKDKFIYSLFKDMFERKIPLKNIDINAYRKVCDPIHVTGAA